MNNARYIATLLDKNNTVLDSLQYPLAEYSLTDAVEVVKKWRVPMNKTACKIRIEIVSEVYTEEILP